MTKLEEDFLIRQLFKIVEDLELEDCKTALMHVNFLADQMGIKIPPHEEM